MARPRTRRIPPALATLAVAALTVSGCSANERSADAPAPSVTAAPPSAPVSPTGRAGAAAGQTPAASPDVPPAVATEPAAAPKRQGDTKVCTFGDVEIRLTPNKLGVYTAIHIPNPSRKSMEFSITVRVTGPDGYAVTMQRSFPSVLPGDTARDAGLLIAKGDAPVPADPEVTIVSFEQSNA